MIFSGWIESSLKSTPQAFASVRAHRYLLARESAQEEGGGGGGWGDGEWGVIDESEEGKAGSLLSAHPLG